MAIPHDVQAAGAGVERPRVEGVPGFSVPGLSRLAELSASKALDGAKGWAGRRLRGAVASGVYLGSTDAVLDLYFRILDPDLRFKANIVDKKRAQLVEKLGGEVFDLESAEEGLQINGMWFGVPQYNDANGTSIEDQKSAVIVTSGTYTPYEMLDEEIHRYLRLGINVITYNPPGYVGSKGERSARNHLSSHEKVYELLGEKGFHHSRIGCSPFSLSNGVVALFAEKHPVQFILFDRSYSSLRKIVDRYASRISRIGSIIEESYDYDIGKALQNVKCENVYFIAAENDALMPLADHAERNFDSFVHKVHPEFFNYDGEVVDQEKYEEFRRNHFWTFSGTHGSDMPKEMWNEQVIGALRESHLLSD